VWWVERGVAGSGGGVEPLDEQEVDFLLVVEAVTLTCHNGRTEGVNTKTKLLKLQMYGRVGIDLLRHRILLG
jgi:hypothetical protein